MTFKLCFYKQHTVPYMHVLSHMRGCICGISSWKSLAASGAVCICNLVGVARLFSVAVLPVHTPTCNVSSVPLPAQCVIQFLNLCHLGKKS